MTEWRGADRVLLDPDLDARLGRDGLVTLPLVDADELRRIEAAYWDLVPAGETGIVLDYLRTDRALGRSLAELLEPVWERLVPDVFACHYPVYSSFVVKHPGTDSSLFLHRDLCVDDERRRRTFSMWMPFEDTGPGLDNGPLEFVRGSERIRHGGYGPNAVGLFAPYEDALRARLEPVEVPAGSAVVYDARMLHASGPNHTGTPRLAVGCLLARRDQPVIQVMATGRRHRVVHQVDRDYFLDAAPQDTAEKGMPAPYPVVAEYDEVPGLTVTEVLDGMLAADEAGGRAVVVPVDLEPVAGRREALPVTPGPRPRHDRDLDIAAGRLDPVGTTAARTVAVTSEGDVGALDLVRRYRRVGHAPPSVPDVVVPLDPFRTVDATLVVLDPWARLTLTAGERRFHRDEVVVLECPAVRAGACVTDRVAELDLGLRVPLVPGEPLHLWNEGPGPLVLVVRATPARGSGGGGAGRAVADAQSHG